MNGFDEFIAELFREVFKPIEDDEDETPSPDTNRCSTNGD